VRIRWNRAPIGTSTCLPPASITDPFDGEATIGTPSANAKDSYLHAGLSLNTAYCYSVFVRTSTGWSAGRTVKARPFDSNATRVKWAYATGGTAVAPPTVSSVGILVMSNDRTIHALDRGSAGGEWPTNWMPTGLVGVAHSRSPVVPFVVPLAGADTVLFAADDATPGFLHAIDARTGNRPWAAQTQGLPMTGAPGGMFTQYGGVRDALFVGTRDVNVNNQLRAITLATGAFLEAYTGAGSPGPIGPINGSPAVDYGTHRIYFASRSRLGGDTLFCLEISPSPTLPVFTYKWSRNLGNITGSPVVRGGRVYVGTEGGAIYSVNADTGAVGDDRSFTPAPADGPVKGFLFPDRRNDDLIFATDTKVWSISDDAQPMTKNWEWSPAVANPNPSIVLYQPQTNLVYVGAANGELYELDFTNANPSTPPTWKRQILGGGLGQVGAPSLDIGVTPQLLVVGSEPGVLYGVEVPFP
jgi:outer membrane protein assembly factor BamB